MIRKRIQNIAQKVQLLKQLDQDLIIFGSSSHRYHSSLASEIVMDDLRREHWAEEYILFLQIVGSVAGPYYGILNATESRERAESVWLVDVSVNDEDLSTDEESVQLMIEAGATRNTIVPICDAGCGERFMLVINGKRKDSLWYDYGFGDNSIRPLEGSFLDFYESWVDHALKQQDKR